MVKGLSEAVGKHLKSQKNAWNGLFLIFRYQGNFRIELLIAITVITAGLLLDISTFDWFGIVFSVAFVLFAEAVNSAIEAMSDAITTKRHGAIRYAKDVAAGAVLMAGGAALVIGTRIFLPFILKALGI